MKEIYFKFNAAKDKFSRATGCFAVGEHGLNNDGTPILTHSCATMEEFEERADYLKGLIDDAAKAARKKLPPKD